MLEYAQYETICNILNYKGNAQNTCASIGYHFFVSHSFPILMMDFF